MILIPDYLMKNLAVWFAAGYQYRLLFNSVGYQQDFTPSGERR